MYAYVGSRTTRERNAHGDGITVWTVDEATGDLTLVQTVGDLVNPSYLLHHPALPVLYTVHGDRSEVSALRIDPASGHLTLLNTQDCQGKNPVHLALDPTGRHLVVSNHITGTLVVLPVADDGALLPVSQRFSLEGTPGPHRVEQPFAKPHFNAFDPTGRWVLVPDKGLDRVFVFRFDAGRLTPAETPFTASREGAGPRHLAFHPTRPWVYVVNELDSTVTAHHFDAQTGRLTPLQVLPTLSDCHTGNSRGAGILVAADGRTLYTSNRGEDSIAVFRIDEGTGRLQPLQTMPSGGQTPRFFTPDPSGRWLLVLNEDSDHITTLAIDADGTLRATGVTRPCGSPVCLVFGG